MQAQHMTKTLFTKSKSTLVLHVTCFSWVTLYSRPNYKCEAHITNCLPKGLQPVYLVIRQESDRHQRQNHTRGSSLLVSYGGSD